jgi:hypothetical protein
MKELMIHVERAVRPVQAATHRKYKMRHELLAHLTAIFEEERGRLGDERAALEEARQRFGDPAELARDLQASVPCLERVVCFRVPGSEGWERWVTKLTAKKTGETAQAHALRLASLLTAFEFCACLLVLVVEAVVGSRQHGWTWRLMVTAVPTAHTFLAFLLSYGFAERCPMA